MVYTRRLGMTPYSGMVIADRYRLDAKLGSGGMGDVWAATHCVTGRPCALKLLRARDDREDRWRRFLNEARAASAVEHPNIVTVHDVFALDHGMAVMVMELVRGETLRDAIARDAPMAAEAACDILVQLISAVGSAHAAGVIHRDIKPSNVLLVPDDDGPRVKVLDFGIAKLAPERAAAITTTGQVLGTPAYMAPEQCRAEPDIDPRADIWALGVIVYELLSGRRPLSGDSLAEIVEALVTEGVPPLRALAPGVPFDLAVMARQMLERDRDRRPPDLRQVFTVVATHATRTAPSFDAPGSALRALPRLESVERGPKEGALRRDGQGAPEVETGSVFSAGVMAITSRGTRWKVAALGGLALVLGYLALGALRAPSQASAERTPSPTPLDRADVEDRRTTRPSAVSDPDEGAPVLPPRGLASSTPPRASAEPPTLRHGGRPSPQPRHEPHTPTTAARPDGRAEGALPEPARTADGPPSSDDEGIIKAAPF
jgi:serine/threonine protein kinase